MQTPVTGHGMRAQEHEPLPNLRQASLPARPRAVLEALLSQASVALERGITATLNEIEQQLFKLAEQARSNEQQNRCFETLREIRRGRADVTPRFVLRLEADLASIDKKREAPAFARMNRNQREQFSLVDPQEFEESLALQEVASKAEIRHSQPLFALGQRFGVLAGSAAVEPEELPLGPHRLCDCFRHAAKCLDVQLEHRVLLYRVFDRTCMSQLGPLYEQLNEICVEHRVLPNLQFRAPRTKRTDAATQPPAAPARAPGGAAPTEPVDGQAGPAPGAGAYAGVGAAAPGDRPAKPGAGPAMPAGGGTAMPASVGAGAPGPQARAAPTPGRSGLPIPPGGAGPASQAPQPAVPEQPHDPRLAGFSNPMTGWPGMSPLPSAPGGGIADARDMELFDTMRDLLAGRRHALGMNQAADDGGFAVRTDDLQSVLAALQGKPAPPMRIGGKTVTRSMSHLKQDMLAQLRQHAPEGKVPRLAEVDNDTIDLVGMLFDHLLKDTKAASPVQDFLTRLQIPLLRVALRDKSFFTRRSHPARQLLNSVAEAGLFWFDDETEDRALIEKMRLVVDRVIAEYDDDVDVFEDLLTDLSKHLTTLARKSEVAERRHVDAARGRERLELARAAAAKAIEDRVATKNAPALIKTLLEQAWTDVLALTILRQGEGSDAYKRRLSVADQLLEALGGEPSVLNPRAEDAEARVLKQEVESGLTQVGYHGDDVQAVVSRLFGGDAAANDDPTSLTELAIKLKSRSRLGSDAEPETRKAEAKPKAPTTPLTPEEQPILERLRTIPFGTWFEFVTNQQGDTVRRKLSWFSTVTGRCLFVNQRGVRVEEKTLETLARDIARGNAKVVEAHKESLIDRAWNAIMSTLKQFAGKGAALTAAPKPA